MEPTTQKAESSNQPTHLAKIRHGHGKHVTYERIGVAWANSQTGSLYVKLHGKQIIEDGFSLYPIDDEPAESSPAKTSA